MSVGAVWSFGSPWIFGRNPRDREGTRGNKEWSWWENSEDLKTMGVDNRCPVRRKGRSGVCGSERCTFSAWASMWFCTLRMRGFGWFWYLPLISLSVARKSRTATKVKCNYGILQDSLQVIDFNSLFTFFFFFQWKKGQDGGIRRYIITPQKIGN